ncbi:SpoIID/LytB domain-containing protein [uncultured Pseudokineococcus sp.]|uniref:SpoIID/LytB domain-containing protein n=1 Tax=uncultured Pseudokineococcus sp. TaxID=1642928 RepID=UPI00262B9D49|nr:SpoIID/LytB domain-containing protein [uncultured Pseudokineococcus sp.]
MPSAKLTGHRPPVRSERPARGRGPGPRRGAGRWGGVLLAVLLAVPLATAAGSGTAEAASGCPAPGGTPAADAAGSPGADLVVHGHGYGHGMGMSQYGARGAALLGCSAGTILRTYYPGLEPRSKALAGRVQVQMLTGGSRAEVRAESGAVTWRSGSSAVVQPAGSTWTVARQGSGLLVRAGTGASAPAVPALAAAAGAALVADHRGVVTRTSTWAASGAAGLVRRSSGDTTRFTGSSSGLAVAELMVDDARGAAVQKYLRGLGEMPVSWPVAAQAAQVVAARSYLVGTWRPAEGAYVVQPTTTDQVWLGADQEETDARHGGNLARAVAETSTGTSGTVMTTASGAVARDLLYASSHGGWSEGNAYVWGSSPVPHLRPVDDSRWDAASSNPYRSWTVELSWDQVARAFGFTAVDAVAVAPRGSADRAQGVVVTGVRGGVRTRAAFTGQQARDRLATVAPAVRSSGFTVSTTSLEQGVALAGDWDGDGLDEVGWWRDGVFTLRGRDGDLRRVRFGPSAGVPVVGDWDGDGRDSIGVVASGRWYLGDAGSTGALLRTFTYGSPGDRPVVGRWAGGPADGIGVVQGSRWLLRSAASPGSPTASAVFGRATDVPAPGDWDGDGTDEPGVRRGRTAHLSGAGSVVLGRDSDSPVSGAWVAPGRDLPGVGRQGVVHVATAGGGRAVQAWGLSR